MSKLESFSVWIFNRKRKDHSCPGFQYVFSKSQPCHLPESGFLFLEVEVLPNGQSLSKVEAKYVSDKLFKTCFNREIITEIEGNLPGYGSFLNKISDIVRNLSHQRKRDIVAEFPIPCHGNIENNLIQIFLVQYLLTVLFLNWLQTPDFWKEKILPLYGNPALGEKRITQAVLRRLSLYIVYLLATEIPLDLNPVLQTILIFVGNWSSFFLEGKIGDEGLYQSELNLSFLRYLVWEIRDRPLIVDQPQIKIFQQADLERTVNQVTRSLTGQFTGMSEHVVTTALKEIRRRLDGCVEECVRNAYPRVKSYLDSSLDSKKDNFNLLKASLEEEIRRSRHLSEQAFQLLDRVARYEERIKHLENKVRRLEGSTSDRSSSRGNSHYH